MIFKNISLYFIFSLLSPHPLYSNKNYILCCCAGKSDWIEEQQLVNWPFVTSFLSLFSLSFSLFCIILLFFEYLPMAFVLVPPCSSFIFISNAAKEILIYFRVIFKCPQVRYQKQRVSYNHSLKCRQYVSFICLSCLSVCSPMCLSLSILCYKCIQLFI